jgi:hypothetical protein
VTALQRSISHRSPLSILHLAQGPDSGKATQNPLGDDS